MSSSDSRHLVLANYVQWMGEPDDIFIPPQIPEPLSPEFGVLEYRYDTHSVYCTAGASNPLQPFSQQVYDDDRGVRFEYLFHASSAQHNRVCELLLMLAHYPFTQHVLYESGSIIPIGAPIVPNSTLAYIYLTYPYQDDPNIYTDSPRGQISTADFLIQTWWAMPISREEATYVQRFGPNAFEKQCFQRLSQQYDVFDFFRPSLLNAP